VRARPAAVQAAVAAFALAVAAMVWLRPAPTHGPEEVVVLPFRPGDVNAVRWDDGSHRVEVVRAVAGEPGVWVRIGRSPSLAPPDRGDGGPSALALGLGRPDGGGSGRLDGGTMGRRADAGRGRPDGGPGALDGGVRALLEALPPPPDRELRGNEVAEKLLGRVSPLTAVRGLGTVSAVQRQQMGLEAPAKTLQLDGRSGTVRFGVSTPPGAAGTYLLGEDGRVWIIADALVQDLISASSRLVDRRLHAFRQEEPDALAIQADGRARRFVFRRVQGMTRLAPEESPDAADAQATAFAERVWRLPPTEVLGRGEVPREGSPQVVLRADYLRDRKPLGFIELARAGNELFARTEHTVSWVRLPSPSATVLAEADRLLSAGSEK
jgi:hypothetical protein